MVFLEVVFKRVKLRITKGIDSIDCYSKNFLYSINTCSYYSGQAGKGNSEEFGLLSLEFDENFCMGGPGVILSRETLRRGSLWQVSDCQEFLMTLIYFSCSTHTNLPEKLI